MNIVPKITSTCECETPGWRLVKQYCPRPDEMPRVEAGQTQRIVRVSDYACALFARAGITPPDKEGDVLSITEVDEKLTASDLSVNERMTAKKLLRDAKLLVPGRHVDTTRR
jgi:hypothetical protein